MNLCKGIFLGILQGATEFLPISSSGHLVLAQNFMVGFRQSGVLFDVLLHFGTLIAVIYYLRKDIEYVLVSLLPEKARARCGWDLGEDSLRLGRRMALLVLIGTIVTGVIGILAKDFIQALFQSAVTASVMLLVTGTLLFLADKIKDAERSEKDMTIADSIVIALAQAVALIPGISRSGTTISVGMFRKLNGHTAARFSFLLSIPAVLGATALQLGEMRWVTSEDLLVYLAGMIAAAITGFLTLKLLFYIITRRNLKIFAYYCWTAGVAALAANMVL